MALSFQGHVHHNIAREWFELLDDRDDARLCFCRVTQLSFLRLITTEAVMGKDEVLSEADPSSCKGLGRLLFVSVRGNRRSFAGHV